MGDISVTKFLGLDKITDPNLLPWGAAQVLENLYVQNGKLLTRQGRLNSPFTLESAGGGTGEIIDIFNHEGYDGNTQIIATNRNLYIAKAKHLIATASSVDNESVSGDECQNPQWLFEITAGTTYIQFYVTKDEAIDKIRGYKVSISGDVITVGAQYTDSTNTSNQIESAWFTQLSSTTGLFFNRRSDGNIYVMAFTYSSATDTISWGTAVAVASGATAYCLKGCAKTNENKAIVVWAENNSGVYTMKAATVSVSGSTCTVANVTNINWSGLDAEVMNNELIASDCQHLKSGRIVIASRYKTSGIYNKAQILGYIGTTLHVSPTYDFTSIALPQPRIVVLSPNEFLVCGHTGANALAIHHLEVFTAQIQLISVSEYNEYATDSGATSVDVRAAVQLNEQQIVLMSRSNATGLKWDMVVFGIDFEEITYLNFSTIQAAPSVTDFTHYGLLRISDTRLLNAVANLGATEDPQVFLLNVSSEYNALKSFTTWYRRLDMASFNNRLVYIAGEMIKTDLTNIWNIGITPPNAAASLATSTVTGTIINGVYDYVYTYYNSTFGIESGPSPISDEIEVTLDQAVNLSSLVTTTDNQVDKIRVYRRKVSIGQTLHFHVEDIDISNTTYQDVISDISVSQLIIAPEVNGDPPIATTVEEHKDRMWYGVGNLLYYSELGRPDIVHVESFLQVGGAGDITALVSFLDNLVIFKENSIWLLTGDAIESFELIVVVPDNGAFNHRCALEVDNVVFHMSHKGLYVFNGQASEYLSRQIEPLWLDLQNLTIKESSIAHDPLRGLLCLTGSVTSTSQFDTVFCFNYREPGWSTWPVDDIGVLATTYNRFGEPKLTYGRINRFGDFNGNEELGSTFTWTLILGNLTFNDSFNEQFLKDLNFIFSKQTDTATVTIGYYINGDISTLTTKQVNLKTGYVSYMPAGRRCERFTPYITGTVIPTSIIEFIAAGNSYGWR